MNSNWHRRETPTSTTVDTAHKNAPANDSFARIRFPFMVVEVVIALEVAARRRARRWPGSWSMWRYRLRWTLQWSPPSPRFRCGAPLVGGTSGAAMGARALGRLRVDAQHVARDPTAKPTRPSGITNIKTSDHPEEEASVSPWRRFSVQ